MGTFYIYLTFFLMDTLIEIFQEDKSGSTKNELEIGDSGS